MALGNDRCPVSCDYRGEAFWLRDEDALLPWRHCRAPVRSKSWVAAECPLEHVRKQLLDFFNEDMLQLFHFELCPYRSNESI